MVSIEGQRRGSHMVARTPLTEQKFRMTKLLKARTSPKGNQRPYRHSLLIGLGLLPGSNNKKLTSVLVQTINFLHA